MKYMSFLKTFVNQIKVPLLILVKVVDFYTPMESLVILLRHLILVTFCGEFGTNKRNNPLKESIPFISKCSGIWDLSLSWLHLNI